MFWKKKGQVSDKTDEKINQSNQTDGKISHHSANPPHPSPATGETDAPTTASVGLGSIHIIGKWAHRRKSKVARPQIAFMPENGATNEQVIKLEEKLEHDHHRKSFEAMLRASLTSRESTDDGQYSSLRAPSLAQQHHHQISLAKQQQEAWKPGYDQIPRPFRQHMLEIERRRARKIIEITNSPDEIYTFTELDSRIRYCPQGTLIFHVLELMNVMINSSTFSLQLPISYYCVLSIGALRRTSKIVHSPSSKRVRVDYTAHFSVEVPEWRESPLNRFKLELWTYQDPEMHYILGSAEIHMYEFIRRQHAIHKSQLWSDGVKVGKVFYEFAFCYGYYGYGHSNHLKNPKNPLMETVSHSMYPRIGLDRDELQDKLFRVRMPELLKVFTYNSLILEMSDAISRESKRKPRLEEIDTKPIIVQQVRYEDNKPVHCKIHMNIWQKELQPDFCDAFGEFICLGTRRTRMDFVYTLMQGRMRDLWEDEAGYLFKPFKDKEAERIQRAEINHPGYIVHPLKYPCPTSLGTPELDKEDEDFLDKFPLYRRGPKYLNVLMGYEKRPEPEVYYDGKSGDMDQNDLDFPLYKEAGEIKRPKECCRCRRLRNFFLWIGAILNLIYNFIFPEVRKPPPVPEISVTTPTPQGSTSKLYTYFVKDSKDTGMSTLDKIQEQTSVLMELANKPEAEDDSSNESSSTSSGDDFDLSLNKTSKQRIIKAARRSVINPPTIDKSAMVRFS